MIINGLENYTESNIRILIADYIDDLLLDMPENEYKYIDMQLIGSRITGNNRQDNDLDVILYYSGSIKEDHLFNILNDDSYRLHIDGIVIDINPKKIYTIQ